MTTTHNLGTLRFDGELLGSISTYDADDPVKAHYWTSVAVYRTERGRFVVEKWSGHEGGDDRQTVRILTSRDAVQEFCGFGALALELYSKMGWPL